MIELPDYHGRHFSRTWIDCDKMWCTYTTVNAAPQGQCRGHVTQRRPWANSDLYLDWRVTHPITDSNTTDPLYLGVETMVRGEQQLNRTVSRNLSRERSQRSKNEFSAFGMYHSSVSPEFTEKSLAWNHRKKRRLKRFRFSHFRDKKFKHGLHGYKTSTIY